MKFPEQFRWKDAPWPYTNKEGDPFGCFIIPADRAPNKRELKIIATSGDVPDAQGWDHVSVSIVRAQYDTPSWEEMCFVKHLFWNPDECVVQYHSPAAQYVNVHPGVLHLWRCKAQAFPMPDTLMV